MKNKIKSAFDAIYADDTLKENTLKYLQNKMKKSSKKLKYMTVKRFAIASTFIFMIFSGILSYNTYFTPIAYVELDINPYVELTINRFNRIIEVYAHNTSGTDIQSSTALKHKDYKEALKILITALEQKGFLKNDSLLSITLQTNKSKKEKELLSNIQEEVSASITDQKSTFQIDIFPVSNDIRYHAHELSISPAKYIAIMELITVDPTVTVESCKNHTTLEIKQLTHTHKENHDSEDKIINEPENEDSSFDNKANEDESYGHQNIEKDSIQEDNEHHGEKGGQHH